MPLSASSQIKLSRRPPWTESSPYINREQESRGGHSARYPPQHRGRRWWRTGSFAGQWKNFQTAIANVVQTPNFIGEECKPAKWLISASEASRQYSQRWGTCNRIVVVQTLWSQTRRCLHTQTAKGSRKLAGLCTLVPPYQCYLRQRCSHCCRFVNMQTTELFKTFQGVIVPERPAVLCSMHIVEDCSGSRSVTLFTHRICRLQNHHIPSTNWRTM